MADLNLLIATKQQSIASQQGQIEGLHQEIATLTVQATVKKQEAQAQT